MCKPNTSISPQRIRFAIGNRIMAELVTFLQEKQVTRVILVSDENEYRAFGARVERTLREVGVSVSTVVLQGDEIAADEASVVQVLLPSDDTTQLYLAVGSGALTDIVRFVSYRTKTEFISLPTAPSVDGFASNGSAMTIQGYKQTILSRPPVAIFADLETLNHAPPKLIAAGFGDMFGKYSALADWKLAHILLDETYREDLAQRSRTARDQVVNQVSVMATNRPQSIRVVMEALVEEGFCMLEAGNSRPASGSEHQISHFWEMKLLRENRPAVFHGHKVGLASIYIAQYYQMLRRMSREQASERLAVSVRPDPEEEIANMVRGYGSRIAQAIIRTQQGYLNMTEECYMEIKNRILEHWDELQTVAGTVPSPSTMVDLMRKVGGPTHYSDIGLSVVDVQEALSYSQYVRGAFTILNVSRVLGWKPEIA